MLLDTFSIIFWSSISSALATLDVEGSSSSVLLRLTTCWAVILTLGISKPKSQMVAPRSVYNAYIAPCTNCQCKNQ